MNAHIVTRNRRTGQIVVATANAALAREVAAHLGATGSEAFPIEGMEITLFLFLADTAPTVHLVADELRSRGFLVTMTKDEEFPERSP